MRSYTDNKIESVGLLEVEGAQRPCVGDSLLFSCCPGFLETFSSSEPRRNLSVGTQLPMLSRQCWR
eukprot:8257951-Lingulodinium_polyedra.AAC.1